jgi:circadian clock protein KaiC
MVIEKAIEKGSSHVPRVRTGIEGLDQLMEGGFPEGRCILLSGHPGSGKTIFSLQYVYKGVTEFDEPSIYVTLDEPKAHLIDTARRFGWNLRDLPEDKFRLIELIPSEFMELKPMGTTAFIKDMAKEIGAKRIVVDPLTTVMLQMQTRSSARFEIMKILGDLRQTKCTSILTSELTGQMFQPEQYLTDAAIVLHSLNVKGSLTNGIQILKMRLTKIDKQVHPYWISSEGFSVNPKVVEPLGA